MFFSSLEGYIFLNTELLMLIAVTSVFYLLREWYQKEQHLKTLENKNLSSELKLLKSQVNPHFLFNALNSVYVLINEDPKKARATLANVSDLLSHQIYDGNKDRVALKKELDHIDNYINLEKMRQADNVIVSWDLRGEVNDEKIAPMLLIPFVENAFKHGLRSGLKKYKLNVLVSIFNGCLEFNCSNEYRYNEIKTNQKGVGLLNVKRRLELIYPGKHTLDLIRNNNLYEVALKINLDEN